MRPRPISYYYGCSDVRHKLARVDLESCEVGGPQVKLFPHVPKKLSNGQEWKSISSVDCKIIKVCMIIILTLPLRLLHRLHYICNLDLRFIIIFTGCSIEIAI